MPWWINMTCDEMKIPLHKHNPCSHLPHGLGSFAPAYASALDMTRKRDLVGMQVWEVTPAQLPTCLRHTYYVHTYSIQR